MGEADIGEGGGGRKGGWGEIGGGGAAGVDLEVKTTPSFSTQR